MGGLQPGSTAGVRGNGKWGRADCRPAPRPAALTRECPMSSVSRREFFLKGGLAAAGTAGLVLRADALPTLPSGHLDHYPEFKNILFCGEAEVPLPGQAGLSLAPNAK